MRRVGLLSVVLVTVLGGSLWAGVADPQIMTNHPVYRGELSCSTLDRTLSDAYSVFRQRYGRQPATDTEKLVAIWSWKSEHSVHSADNLIYVGPDDMDAQKEGARAGWMDNRDCQMNQFSFGFALCYSIHAQMTALVSRALGDNLRRVRNPIVPGHTPFEAYVDNKWALADMTTGMMVFDDEGNPMSIEEIVPHAKADETKWLTDPKRGGPYSFAMGPYGDNWDVYKEVKEYMMLTGYDAMPIVYSLRSGESFTRYLDPGLEDGKTYMFWAKDYYNLGGKPVHGPYRGQTFLDDYPIGEGRKGRSNVHQANGIFEYNVPIAEGTYKEGVKAEQDTVLDGGVLRGKSDQASVTFEHVSPYIIAAWPEKRGDREWDLLTEKCVDGAVVTGMATGKVPVSVSLDGGHTWKSAGTAEGDFKVDFTDIAKGRFTYQVRFDLRGGAGLKGLKLRTVVQVGRGVVPRLKDGGTKITFQASAQSVIHGGPSQYQADVLRRKDLETEGYRVMEIKTPAPICQASAMMRASGPDRGPWSVAYSLDEGKTWMPARKDVTLTRDDSQWGGGHHAYMWAQIQASDPRSRGVLFRVGKGNISHAEIYATYQKRNTSPVEVTFAWTEGDQLKQDTHAIKAGKSGDNWTVPTGQNVKTKWVRIAAK
jgi:hypothetical protein